MRLMRTGWVSVFIINVFIFLVFSVVPVVAQEKDKTTKPSASARLTEVPAAKGLQDLIPLSTELSRRSLALKSWIEEVSDVTTLQENLDRIASKIDAKKQELKNLEDTGRYGFTRLAELKATLEAEDKKLEGVIDPLKTALSRLGESETEWIREKKLWQEMKTSLSKDVPKKSFDPVFAKANQTISEALKLAIDLTPNLLGVQQKAIGIQEEILGISARLDSLLVKVRADLVRKSAPSMFSTTYYTQFRRELWGQIGAGFKGFFSRGRISYQDGLLLFAQAWIVLAVFFGVRRHRKFLGKEKHWEVMVKHPLAVALLASHWIIVPFYQAESKLLTFFLWTIASVTTARILANYSAVLLKKVLVYGLAALLISLQFFSMISLPIPFFRLYVLFLAVVGLVVTAIRVKKSFKQELVGIYGWLLRLILVLFAGIVVSEVVGYSALAKFFLASVLRTFFLLAMGLVFLWVAEGGLKVLVHRPFIQRMPILRQNSDVIVKSSTLLLGLLIGNTFFAYMLVVWRLHDGSALQAMYGFLSYGFTVGSQQITVGIIIAAVVVVQIAFLLSWIVQAVLVHGVLAKRQVQAGVRLSIGRLVHYALIFVGFLFALLTLGFDLKNVTIIGGALGIGVGFGLQNIVNNFVCGIILLFERPIKIGDYIQFGEKWGRVTKMGLRSTVVRIRDRSEVVVPNSELISQKVTNLTLTDRFIRIIIPVGVAYGSDVSTVLETLKECAKENPFVVTTPEPKALFMGFGDSSLNFELRVWVSDIDKRRDAQSALHQDIDKRFRDADIEIPFPQRDLHIRGKKEPAI